MIQKDLLYPLTKRQCTAFCIIVLLQLNKKYKSATMLQFLNFCMDWLNKDSIFEKNDKGMYDYENFPSHFLYEDYSEALLAEVPLRDAPKTLEGKSKTINYNLFLFLLTRIESTEFLTHKDKYDTLASDAIETNLNTASEDLNIALRIINNEVFSTSISKLITALELYKSIHEDDYVGLRIPPSFFEKWKEINPKNTAI